MKKKDVPQDKGYMDGRFKDVYYAQDEEGNFVPVLSEGWQPKNDAMKLAWEAIYEKVEEARKAVIEGKYSPIYFFMVKNIMDVKLLAEYMELPKRIVRRHLKPGKFNKLEAEVLQQYAELFKITIEQLVNFNEGPVSNEEG